MNPQTPKNSYTLEEMMTMYGASKPNIQPSIQIAQEVTNPYNATFRATGEEGGIKAGLKAAGNLPTSAYTFGKNIIGAVTSPLQTAKAVGGAITDIGRTGMNIVSGLVGSEKKQETPTLDALGNVISERYGSVEKAQKTAIEDPFGVGSDILGVLTGGAGVLGKGALATKAIGTVGGAVTSPLARAGSGFSEKVARSVRFGVSQATGLSPETVSTIAKNRTAFSKATGEGVGRTDLAENVLDAVKKAKDELSDLGSGYDEIRAAQTSVSLPSTWLQSSLDKYGLKFQAKKVRTKLHFKVSADKSSATRNTTDINKIQEFIDNWGDSKTLTPAEYLNMRHDLAELAKYEVASGKSSVVQQFAQDVREGVLNSDKIRGQVPGLKELDAKFTADKTFFKQMEKDFINKQTGGLKDGAASKVVNAVNAANPERLARLEKLYPGFTKQAKVIKAIEDVEAATGAKTGTYVRAGVIGGAAVTGNLPLVVTAILSTPEIAVPLIKGYGWTAEQISPVLKVAKEVANDINNFRTPGAIEQYLNEKYPNGVPVGMSIKSTVTPEKIAKSLTLEEYRTINEYLLNPADKKFFPKAQNLIEKFDINNASDDVQMKFLREVKDEYDSNLNKSL